MTGPLNYTKLLGVIDSNLADSPLNIEILLRTMISESRALSRWIENDVMVEEGKTYLIPDDKVYKSIAFLRVCIQMQIVHFKFSEKTNSNLHLVLYSLKEARKKIEQNPQLLGLDRPVEGLDTTIQQIKKIINQLEDKSEAFKKRELLKEPVSEAKIREFKEMILKQWYSSRTLSQVFEYFDAVQYNPNEKLQKVGLHKIQFKGGRIMFVEQTYQMIYGIEWGFNVSSEVTKYFLQRLKDTTSLNTLKSETYLEALDNILNNYPETNIAFVSTGTSFILSRPLSESGHFTDSDNSQLNNLPFQFLGVYKEKLLIITLRNRTMTDAVVGLKLPGSIIMKRRTNESWIEGKLQLDIKEINDENVKQILLDSNPTADTSNPKVLEEAKTGILIELDETIDFIIQDANSIIIATVKEKFD